MLIKAKTMTGFKLHGLDAEMGTVKEFYFDDQHWTIRYCVADTGTWLSGKQVLISPHALLKVNKEEKNISVDLTKKQIEDSPLLGSDKPVSKQFEESYYGYFGWPVYWAGPYKWGATPHIGHGKLRLAEDSPTTQGWDPHLRSTQDVCGHDIQATDGEIGNVEDFIIDDLTWTIRYLAVDTGHWWPGKFVLVSPHWIEKVSWRQSKVFVNLLRENIKQSPEYSEKSLLNRDYEDSLYQHYGRPGYWVEEPVEK